MPRDLENILWLSDDVGMHRHGLLLSTGGTATDGAHSHVWLVPSDIETPMGMVSEGRILFGNHDGAHRHMLNSGLVRTEQDGAHLHGVSIRGLVMASAEGGAHGHELSVERTGHGGVHSHALSVGGLTLTSLVPKDFFTLMAEAMVPEEEVALSVTEESGHYVVRHKGQAQTVHRTLEGAERRLATQELFLRCGLEAATKDLDGVEWLAKATAQIALKTQGLNDRLAGTFERLAKEI